MSAGARTRISTASQPFTCLPTVIVGDAVYITVGGVVDKAFAAAPPTPESIGVVISKSSSTSCRVVKNGDSGPIFIGLIPGNTYFLSNAVPGAIFDTPTAFGVGDRVQEIGKASSATNLDVGVDQTSTIA